MIVKQVHAFYFQDEKVYVLNLAIVPLPTPLNPLPRGDFFIPLFGGDSLIPLLGGDRGWVL